MIRNRRHLSTLVFGLAGMSGLVAGCGSDAPSTTAAPTTITSTTITSTTITPPTVVQTALPPTTVTPSTLPATSLPTTVAITAAPSTLPPTTAATTTTTVPVRTVPVLIYGIRDEHLVVMGRLVGAATPADALAALVQGPTASEVAAGIETMIPAGTELLGVTVDGADATVDLSAPFDTGGGVLPVVGRAAQVVFTVTQFPGIERVHFAIDGTVVTTLTGEGLMVDGIGRLDVADVIPIILLEHPTDGATVSRPIHVSGVSNTFEAVINYQLLDPTDRTVLVEGNLMATSGTGTWGTFDRDLLPLPSTIDSVIVRVFEYSAKDGEPINITEVTVTLS